MKSKFAISVFALLITVSLSAQQSSGDSIYLQKINKELPHKFKALKIGATLEAIREKNDVKLYMLIDDIEQYSQILIERSDELQQNFSQCKVIEVEKGKYKNNYLEVTDHYPLSSKMTNVYRIKTVNSEGNSRMFPPVAIVKLSDK